MGKSLLSKLKDHYDPTVFDSTRGLMVSGAIEITDEKLDLNGLYTPQPFDTTPPTWRPRDHKPEEWPKVTGSRTWFRHSKARSWIYFNDDESSWYFYHIDLAGTSDSPVPYFLSEDAMDPTAAALDYD